MSLIFSAFSKFLSYRFRVDTISEAYLTSPEAKEGYLFVFKPNLKFPLLRIVHLTNFCNQTDNFHKINRPRLTDGEQCLLSRFKPIITDNVLNNDITKEIDKNLE